MKGEKPTEVYCVHCGCGRSLGDLSAVQYVGNWGRRGQNGVRG